MNKDSIMKQYYGWYYYTDWEPEGEAGWVGPYDTEEEAIFNYHLAMPVYE